MDFLQRATAGRSAVTALILLMLLGLFGPVSAASAHESLTGTSPADGETVAAMPEAIELSFTNTPIELGSQVSIADADGTNWAEGEVEIVGDVATQQVKAEAPAGEYSVTWRVVSSDSHPIEGAFTFTAGAAGAGVGSPVPLESPSSAAEPAGDAQEAPTTFPTSVVVVMIGVLVVLVVVIAVLARRRLGRNAGERRF